MTATVRLEVYRDKAKQWRWRMVAANNKRLGGPGEGFHNRDDCLLNAEIVTDATARGIPVVTDTDTS